MPNQRQLTLFGSPEVRRHGQPVTGFRTSKVQALLYYLAVTGRSHTRATQAGLRWGAQPEDAACQPKQMSFQPARSAGRRRAD